MAGIYLHIPFCRQKCTYCNFFSLASRRHLDAFSGTLIKELEIQQHYLGGEPVETIYFGGGTPSLLDPSSIAGILEKIRHLFIVVNDAEITLEANPDDLCKEQLNGIRDAGINRLSIGIQSFHDDDLKFLNRIHSADEAISSISLARETGFNNLSIDLIYGIPGQDSSRWEFNVKKSLELEIPHISSYALTVEERTPLERMIASGKVPPVDDFLQEEHFSILCSLMEQEGYLHYEISNFCKPGMFAKHNTSYWKGVAYLGAGPSAHSYNGNSRQWNISNLTQYMKSISDGLVPSEMEQLSEVQKFNEYIMTSLRTMWGCDLSHIEQAFGKEWKEKVIRDSLKYLQGGFLIRNGNLLLLTMLGRFRADGIASDLFRTDE